MSTFLLFLLGSLMAGVFMHQKPAWMRLSLSAAMAAYMCYAYSVGGAQF